MANQPIFILPEGTERYSKKDALRMNITAGKVLANIVRTTLDPKGRTACCTREHGSSSRPNMGVR